MKRRSFIKSALAAIAVTASGLRLAEGGIVESERVDKCVQISEWHDVQNGKHLVMTFGWNADGSVDVIREDKISNE